MKTIIAIMLTMLLATGAQAAYINHVTVDTGAIRINNTQANPVNVSGTVTVSGLTIDSVTVTMPDTIGVSGQVGIIGAVAATISDTLGVNVGNWPAVQAVAHVAYTITGSCTTAGGLTAVLCDLGDTYDLIYVTCEDSAVIGLTGATNIGNGERIDRVMLYPFRTRYIWVCTEVAYVYPRCVRVRGMR